MRWDNSMRAHQAIVDLVLRSDRAMSAKSNRGSRLVTVQSTVKTKLKGNLRHNMPTVSQG